MSWHAVDATDQKAWNAFDNVKIDWSAIIGEAGVKRSQRIYTKSDRHSNQLIEYASQPHQKCQKSFFDCFVWTGHFNFWGRFDGCLYKWRVKCSGVLSVFLAAGVNDWKMYGHENAFRKKVKKRFTYQCGYALFNRYRTWYKPFK